MIRRVSIGAIAALAATVAQAADITLERQGDISYVIVSGELVAGDGDRFVKALLGADADAVVLSSPGGNLLAGLEIGKAVRLFGANTIVPDGQLCASACALAWLGGARRFMGPDARVGFHAAYRVDAQGEAQETGSGNALVGAYVNQLGLSDTAVVYITQAAPESIQWLTVSDAQELGIAVATLGARVPQGPAPTPEPQPRVRAPAYPVCYVDDVRPPDAWLALRSDPSSRSGRQLARLPSGTAMEMLGEQTGHWYRVRVPSGQIGWVSWQVARWIRC